MINEYIASIDGVRDLMYLSIKKSKPSVSIEEISLLINEANIGTLTPVIEYICGFSSEEETSEKKEGTAEKKA